MKTYQREGINYDNTRICPLRRPFEYEKPYIRLMNVSAVKSRSFIEVFLIAIHALESSVTLKSKVFGVRLSDLVSFRCR